VWIAELSVFLVQPQSYLLSDSGLSKSLRPSLSWTVSPEVTLGYQFAYGDAVLVSYRYLGCKSEDSDPFVIRRTPLDSNWIDLDYRTQVFYPCSTLSLQCQGGCRIGVLERNGVYESSSASAIYDGTFVGAGPHFDIRCDWHPWVMGLGFFARSDLGLLVGALVSETPQTTSTQSSLSLSSAAGDFDYAFRHTHVLATQRLDLGVSWRSVARPWLFFEGGIRVEDFFEISDNIGMASIVHNFGPFGRCTIRY
jgi:hypothetical protein